MKDLTVSQFVSKVASNEAVPGGGSVAALSAGLGAALASMLAKLTIGKKGYEEANDKMTDAAAKLDKQAALLLDYIELDCQAFSQYMAAVKMPKQTEKEVSVRAEAMNKAILNSTETPLKVAKISNELMNTVEYVVANGNKNALSDGIVAGLLLRSAALSALYNVMINVPSIKDESVRNKFESEVKKITAEVNAKEAKIVAYFR